MTELEKQILADYEKVLIRLKEFQKDIDVYGWNGLSESLREQYCYFDGRHSVLQKYVAMIKKDNHDPIKHPVPTKTK